MCIAVRKVDRPLRELTCHTGSHKCYLPPGRSDIPGTFNVTLKERDLLLATRRKACWKKLDKLDKFKRLLWARQDTESGGQKSFIGGHEQSSVVGFRVRSSQEAINIYNFISPTYVAAQHNIRQVKLQRCTSSIESETVLSTEHILHLSRRVA